MRKAYQPSNRKLKSRRSDISELNVLKRSKNSTEEGLRGNGDSTEVTYESTRGEVRKLVDKMFEREKGSIEPKLSCCSVPKLQPKRSQYKLDKRLQYWKDHVEERKQMAAYIEKRTWKKRQDVLFNRRSTVDEPTKRVVQRVIDYADRMHPITLMTKKTGKLKAYVDACTCTEVPEVEETLPKAEREKFKAVEIIGMPRVTKEEQFDAIQMEDLKHCSRWMKSEVLGQRIDEKAENIERVLEFYPDIDKLQVVGVGYDKLTLGKHNSEIELLSEDCLRSISSDTTVGKGCLARPNSAVQNTLPEYGVKINDQVFSATDRRSSQNVELETVFVCEPYQTVAQRVLSIENIGQKVINCIWLGRPYHERNADLLKATDDEFVFDQRPFRLIAGETRDIVVQYQPRKVENVKQRWLLKLDPQFFCQRADSVTLKFTGKCLPSSEYVTKLDEVQRDVIDKSNLSMIRKINSNLASLTPLVRPTETLCPYQRALNECEIFEFQNPGIKCDRFNDLEQLKSMYNSVKKPREPAWDLDLDTLKNMILRNEGAGDRSIMFSQLMYVVNNMRGEQVNLEAKIETEENFERERTRLLFVRGVISSGIDEWENIAAKVEEAFVKSVSEEYVELAYEQQKQYMVMEHTDSENLIFPSNFPEMITEAVVPIVRRQKVLRDTLYMQTYSHLCDIAESIVNVIEGTDGV